MSWIWRPADVLLATWWLRHWCRPAQVNVLNFLTKLEKILGNWFVCVHLPEAGLCLEPILV
jgi:hypothetical protein